MSDQQGTESACGPFQPVPRSAAEPVGRDPCLAVRTPASPVAGYLFVASGHRGVFLAGTVITALGSVSSGPEPAAGPLTWYARLVQRGSRLVRNEPG